MNAQTWRPETFMRYMASGAPGTVDLLALLEAHRAQCKPSEDVLSLTEAHVKSGLTLSGSETAEVRGFLGLSRSSAWVQFSC